MNMVKKLSVFCLVLCLTLCLAACVAGGGEDTDGGSTTTTASTTTTTASNLSTYTVTVKTENGEPVVGVMVQICKELCVPTVTDANGVSYFAESTLASAPAFAFRIDGITELNEMY